MPDHWTTQTPTAPGVYWWRPALGDVPTIVRLTVRGWVHVPGIGRGFQPESYAGQWYGPLEPPGGDAIENCPDPPPLTSPRSPAHTPQSPSPLSARSDPPAPL